MKRLKAALLACLLSSPAVALDEVTTPQFVLPQHKAYAETAAELVYAGMTKSNSALKWEGRTRCSRQNARDYRQPACRNREGRDDGQRRRPQHVLATRSHAGTATQFPLQGRRQAVTTGVLNRNRQCTPARRS